MKKIFRNKKLIKIDGFEIPKFWECGWRRVPCGKKNCLLCGKILQNRQGHIKKGENPDDLKSVFEDVGSSLAEALAMIKKDAERMGIEITNIDKIQEPPCPSKFSLYRNVSKWRNRIELIAEHAVKSGDLWIETEAAADLLWYKNTLAAKTYRQLCNRWHMDNGDEYGDIDYEYTKYVIGECVLILKKSLQELSLFASEQKGELVLAIARLHALEKQILKI